MDRISRRAIAAFFLLASIPSLGFLVISKSVHGIGFPLDDAWIHQTYARNLVQYGEWSYIPGEPSGGSTSPLWTLLIAIGRWIGIEPTFWTFAIGLVTLLLLAWVGFRWLRQTTFQNNGAWIILAVMTLEWHLVWASVSGMETLAVALLILSCFYLMESNKHDVIIGALIGTGLWLRPGVLTLMVPAMIYLVDRHRSDLRQMLNHGVWLLVGFGLLAGPYLYFNFVVAGTIWPNTFYAKQAEYAILVQAPLIQRFLNQFVQPMIGAGIILLPGIALAVVKNRRNISHLAPLLWVLVYLGSYAVKLPVTYQHGRYAIPVIPVVLVFGIEGFLGWVKPGSTDFARRFLSRLWGTLLAAVMVAFWLIGARAYASDVAIIQTEMVDTAKWIEANTDADALIAAHDIGALGFFGDRRILDMAGLISPEVIPFIRDEKQLADFIDKSGADYLMTFPEWYPELTHNRSPVYQSDAEFSPSQGGENMAVYRWP